MSNFSIGGRGGNPIPSTTLVATDQETIFGDGSGQNPLTTAGGSSANTFIALTTGSHPLLVVGDPVADAGGAHAIAGINSGDAAYPTGVVVSDPENPPSGLRVQTGGIVTLTTAQWDAVTSQSGGLTPGFNYYAGDAPSFGALYPDIPIGALIGWALSSTELVLRLGTPPNTLLMPSGLAVQGAAVSQSSGTLALVNAATLGGCVTALGICLLAGTPNSVVATTGQVVTLPTGVWDSVVSGESGGLTEGAIYYASATTSGDLTTTAPVTTGTFQLRIGIGLSSTQLLVSVGTPIGPHA